MDSETHDILDDATELGPDGYETAADAELGQLVAQSVARTGPLDPDAVHSYEATGIVSRGTITADIAEILTDVDLTFRVDGDEDLPSGVTSTGDRLSVELAGNKPDADARVLRVLAARVARAGTTNEDFLLTLTDIAAALRSLRVAVARMGSDELSDEDGPESFKIYADTLDHLRHAADGVAEIAGWV
jgi:hypothetical protein